MGADISANRSVNDHFEKRNDLEIQYEIQKAIYFADRVVNNPFEECKSLTTEYKIMKAKTLEKRFEKWKSLLSEYEIKESKDLAEMKEKLREKEKERFKCGFWYNDDRSRIEQEIQEIQRRYVKEAESYLSKILQRMIVKLQNLTIIYKRCQDSNKYKSNKSDVLMTIRRQIRNYYWLSDVKDKLSEDENQNLISNLKEEIKNLAKRWIEPENIMLGIGPCFPSAYLTTREQHKHAKAQVILRKKMTITDGGIYKRILLQLKEKTSYDWKNMADDTTIDENKQQNTANHHVNNSLGFRGNRKVTFTNPWSKNISTTKLLNCDMIEFIDKEKQKSENKHCMETGEMPVNKHSEMSGDKRNIKCNIPKLTEASEQGYKRIYGYNWKFILFAAIFWINVFSGNCSFNCTDSRQTRMNVDICPDNKTAWIAAATIKDCSAVLQNCISKENFVYHCLLDTDENTLIEICAVRHLFFRSCPYFNNYSTTLERRKLYHCNTCKRAYYSNEVYKHPECYKTQMAITKEPLSQTYVVTKSEQGVSTTVPNPVRHENNYMHTISIVSISGFLVVVGTFVTFAIRRWKLRCNERNRRNAQQVLDPN